MIVVAHVNDVLTKPEPNTDWNSNDVSVTRESEELKECVIWGGAGTL